MASKEYLDAIYNKLNAEEFEKDLFDENLGAVPHEILEGNLTALVMLRKFDLIPSKFINQFNKELPYIERIFLKNNDKPFTAEEIFSNERIYDNIGGHVHEIIEKSTPGYSAWQNYVFQKTRSGN